MTQIDNGALEDRVDSNFVCVAEISYNELK